MEMFNALGCILIICEKHCSEVTWTKTVHVKKNFTFCGTLLRQCTGQEAAFGLPSNSDEKQC
jgi:hypothetical protein